MIIGITGYLAAGKGEAAEYLSSRHGFIKRGYGDVIRAELTKMGVPLGRDAEYAYANEMRQKFGFGYWSKMIVETLKPGEDVVVEGVRNPGELPELSAAGDFYLIAIEAPVDKRFERVLSRKKIGDPTTFDEMKEKSEREAENEDPNKQRIQPCIDKADFVVVNDGDLESFHDKLDKIVEGLKNDR